MVELALPRGAHRAPAPGWRGAGVRQCLALLLCASVIALALLALAGWLLQCVALVRLRTGVAPIQFNTALALMLLGVAIALAGSARRWPTRAAAAMGAVLAVTTLLQYVGHLDLGIDELFLHHYLNDRTPYPGRMAPASAFAILLGAAGAWSLAMPLRSSWARAMTQSCAGAMAIVVLIGLWQSSQFRGQVWHPGVTEIAPQTVLLALALAWALALRAAALHRPAATTKLERLGAWSITSMLVLSFLMWQALERKNWYQQSGDIATAATRMALQLESGLEHRGHALMRLAQDWDVYGAPGEEQWTRAASHLLRDYPSFKAIAFVDPHYVVRWRVSDDGRNLVGSRYDADQRRRDAYQWALRSRAVQLVTQLELRSGGRGLVYFAPVFERGAHRAFILASIQRDQLQHMVDQRLSENFSFVVRDGDGAVVRASDGPRQPGSAVHRVSFDVLGKPWSLEAWSRPDHAERSRTALPLVALLVGFSAAAFMAVAFGFARRTAQDRQDAQRLGERLTETLESIGDAFLLIDQRRRLQFANGQAERLLDMAREDLLGCDVLDALPQTVGSVFQHRLTASFLSQTSVQFIEFCAPLDKWLDVRAYPSHDSLSVYFRDVSQERRIQEQLRQSQQLESIGQLSGGVAHDFNNLLTVILGNAEVLSDELARDVQLQPLAQMIVEGAQRGAELTQRMLAFARRQPLAPRVVDVDRLIAGFDGMARRMLGEDIDVAIVQGHGSCLAIVDPTQLESALLNLCVNARDAMPTGGKLTLETSCVEIDAIDAQRQVELRIGHYVLVAVTDTGCGIPAENLARVFEPFFTTKEKGRGTGLGLAMVYGLVKQSGGHAAIYSEPGQGTTVRLYLPCAQPGAQEDAPAAPGAPESLPARQCGTVLVVEDEAQVRQFARDQLVSLGYRVLEAGDGAQALEIVLRNDDIDLLFTDVVMPGALNGRQLADAAREHRPGLRVLFTSGYTANAIVHQGRLDSDVMFLPKPYGRAMLVLRVREALETGK